METAVVKRPEYYRGFQDGLIEGGRIFNEAFMKYVQNGSSPTVTLNYEVDWIQITDILPPVGMEIIM